MDQKQVERQILDNIEIDGCECGHVLEVTVWKAAKIIVEAHEEELQAARRESAAAILPCGHHASNAISGDDGDIDPLGEGKRGQTNYCRMCDLERISRGDRNAIVAYLRKLGKCQIERDQLQAKVAVMAGALNKLIDAAIDRVEYEQGDDILEVRIHEANAALSAAPKVLYSTVGRVEPSGDVTTGSALDGTLGYIIVPADIELKEQQVQVFVMGCSVKEGCKGRSER